jgi:HlyD family secretion protein
MRMDAMTTMKLGVAAVLVMALGLGACGRKPPAPSDQATARAVRVAVIDQRRLSAGVSASGLLISREEVAVNPELSGYRVAAVFVEMDARVKAGQPLAQLDDTLLRSQIAQQTALVAQQQVAADQADVQLNNVAGLQGQGVLSAEQLDQRRFAARSSHASLDAQIAQLRDLQTRDERMTIRAPTAGLVLERNVRPGDVALGGAGSTPMFRMARDGLIELEAQVAEDVISAIRVGDAVEVELPDGTKVEGAVRLISPSIDPQTKLGKVRVRLPERDDLRAGGFGRATFVGTSRLAAAAPETAIRYDANGPSVMVVGADDRVSQVFVKTGVHSGGYVELVQGPPVGSRVLMGAAVFVLQGDRVKPVAAQADPAVGAR